MHVFHGNMDGRVGFERVIGHEMSGTIDSAGADAPIFSRSACWWSGRLTIVVTALPLWPGRGHLSAACLILGLDTNGAMQEYWCVPAHAVHELPDEIRMDYAALIEPVAVACHDVRLSHLKAGEDVVVIGGGPIGVLVAMVARDAGGKVVISEVNPHRLGAAKLSLIPSTRWKLTWQRLLFHALPARAPM